MATRTIEAQAPVEYARLVARRALQFVLYIAIFSLALLWASPGGNAQSEQDTAIERAIPTRESNHQRISREYFIKAAIIFNLAKFTTWPDSAFASPDAPLRLCVMGVDPFGAALNSIEGKAIGDRTLFSANIDNLQSVAACHILWVSDSETERLDNILNAVAQQPILTVADMPEFALSGGIVGLAEEDDRSRLQVNIAAADQAGLLLSSKLLRLAEIVGVQFVQPIHRPK